MTFPRQVRAVVFDMDGLLVDTETLCRDAMTAQAQAMGRDLPLPVFLTMVGTNRALSEQILVDHFGASFALADFHAGWRERYHARAAGGVRLKAGAVELLDHLDRLALPRAVCTSSPHWEVDRNLAPHSLRDRFRAVVAHGDYAQGKPHPEPFLTAAAALGVDPAHCLALEDSHNGVRAAHGAGMMTVMIPDLLDPTHEISAMCVHIAENLHEVRVLILAPSNSTEQA